MNKLRENKKTMTNIEIANNFTILSQKQILILKERMPLKFHGIIHKYHHKMRINENEKKATLVMPIPIGHVFTLDLLNQFEKEFADALGFDKVYINLKGSN